MDFLRKDFPLVMVSGPRVYRRMATVTTVMQRLFHATQKPTLRQGGAGGADTLAKLTAGWLGWQVEPDWKPRYDSVPAGWPVKSWQKVAPLRRTEDMLNGKNGPAKGMWSPVPPDVLLVFRDGPELPTGGTGHAVREARKRGIPIIVIETPEDMAEEISDEQLVQAAA